MSSVYFKEYRTTWPLSSKWLVKFNPQVSYAIRKNSPESRTCVYIYRKLRDWIKSNTVISKLYYWNYSGEWEQQVLSSRATCYSAMNIRVKTVLSGFSGGKGLPHFVIFRISESYAWLYVSVSNTLVDVPNTIYHLISCPVFLAAL